MGSHKDRQQPNEQKYALSSNHKNPDFLRTWFKCSLSKDWIRTMAMRHEMILIFLSLGAFLLAMNVVVIHSSVVDQQREHFPLLSLRNEITNPLAQNRASFVNESGQSEFQDVRDVVVKGPSDSVASLSNDADQQQQQHHNNNNTMMIPNIITFTHAKNLLREDFSLPSTNNIEDPETKDILELRVLQANVRHIIRVHPGAQIRFLTDTDCIESLRRVYGTNTSLATALVESFQQETTGMYKADLCRGVALYETGGLYFDVDLGVRMNIWKALKEQEQQKDMRTPTTFATIRVHSQSLQKGAFFQAFIAAAPQHPVLKRYVELFLDYYHGKLRQYRGKPLGVVLLKRAYDEEVAKDERLEKSTQLWQEVFYSTQWQRTLLKHVPPPTWGTRRVCKFIVVSHLQKKMDESTGKAVIANVTVPFYSRIAGSRMCPASTTTTANLT